MTTYRLSLRERFIGAGLLRPVGEEERVTAFQKCSTYLQTLAFADSHNASASDTQLTIAVLERWYSS